MDRPLREHVSHLEQRLRLLNNQLMEASRTIVERNRIESEIRAAELALVYYRKALELEKQLR
jgi:hypothetical protein